MQQLLIAGLVMNSLIDENFYNKFESVLDVKNTKPKQPHFKLQYIKCYVCLHPWIHEWCVEQGIKYHILQPTGTCNWLIEIKDNAMAILFKLRWL